jgi:hypothetical protein
MRILWKLRHNRLGHADGWTAFLRNHREAIGAMDISVGTVTVAENLRIKIAI